MAYLEEQIPIPFKLTESSREETIEWIMEQFGESMKRFIFTYVKSKTQMDDIFQEVMIKVYKKIDTIQDPDKLKNWLYKITANTCKDYLRSPIHRLLVWKDDIEKKSMDTPEQRAILDEQKKMVIRTILDLPVKYREVLILQYYQEFSIQEISDLLNVNPSTVRTRILRAKEKLKVMLKEDYLDE